MVAFCAVGKVRLSGVRFIIVRSSDYTVAMPPAGFIFYCSFDLYFE